MSSQIDPPDHHLYRRLLDPMFAPQGDPATRPCIGADDLEFLVDLVALPSVFSTGRAASRAAA